MSGWIRVKELPTRYEVRCESGRVFHKTERSEALRYRASFRGSKMVTIRRWQVKRTNVVEQRYKNYTSWHEVLDCETHTSVVTPIEAFKRGVMEWHLCPRPTDEPKPYATREEAEAAARKWLDGNGYRIAKVAT